MSSSEINEIPLTFRSKSQLSGHNVGSERNAVQPSTCVDAEPYALQVLDDSMEPEFWSGCIILIDPTGRVAHNSFVLAKVSPGNNESESFLFRQLQQHGSGKWVLNALNDNYPSQEIDASFNDVVGVIVQRAGKRRHQHKRYDH